MKRINLNLTSILSSLLSVPLFVAEAVQGTHGHLPCNVTPPLAQDKVILVIWYKDELSKPIYR